MAMKIRILAGIWTTDSSTGNELASNEVTHMAPDLSERLLMVRAMAVRANSWIRERRASNPADDVPTLGIFVGPEYLFAPQADKLLQDEKGKRQVEETAKFLSEQLPLLIIPGTVSWKKPFTEARKAKTIQKIDKDLNLRYQQLTAEGQSGNPAPDYGTRIGFYARDVELHKQTIQALSNSPLEQHDVALNTAFVYFQGERLLKYHKKGNSCEVLAKDVTGKQQPLFSPGERDGYFVVKHVHPDLNDKLKPQLAAVDLECGLEICYDHRIGYISNGQKGKIPHLHFITSAWVAVEQPRVSVKAGGVVVHASSNAQVSGIFDESARPFKETDTVGGWTGKMLCYDLTLSFQ